MAPHAFGELILVPFISWLPRSVQLGTAAMAPPGAVMETPRSPSALTKQPNRNAFSHQSFKANARCFFVRHFPAFVPSPLNKCNAHWQIMQQAQSGCFIQSQCSGVGVVKTECLFRCHPVFQRTNLWTPKWMWLLTQDLWKTKCIERQVVFLAGSILQPSFPGRRKHRHLRTRARSACWRKRDPTARYWITF